MLTVVKFLEKMDMCGRRSQKRSEEHQCAILSKRNQDRKGIDIKQTHPLKSFELFFDDAVITEIVTWTNQKTGNVKTSYTSKPGFLYNTSVTEIRALIGILLFLGTTTCSKDSSASIWAKDGTGKPICIATMSRKRFFVSCVLLTL